MPRFVILEHDYPQIHWDLMLESGRVLRTWRLLNEPLSTGETLAESAFDHRLLYLDYEGPVSNDRGSVKRWDVGDFLWIVDTEKEIQIELFGARIRSLVSLRRIADSSWSVTYVSIRE